MTESAINIPDEISSELSVSIKQVDSVLQLILQGNTVPFIARYRKEVTEGLDEVQIRSIKEGFEFFQELEDRKKTVLNSIKSQNKLTQEIKIKINRCKCKKELEDLYLPFKPKRRTKAMIAREKGLEELANFILSQVLDQQPEDAAQAFIDADKGVNSVEEALQGARDIVAEVLAETAEIRAFVREQFSEEGILEASVRKDYKDKVTKFQQYYEFQESLCKVPSHRFLAMRRGEREDVLRVNVEVEEEMVIQGMKHLAGLKSQSPFSADLLKAIEDSYRRLLSPSVETEVLVEKKRWADEEAVRVFAENLDTILMSAPFGGRSVIGVDPGLRTGCKYAVLEDTGRYVESGVWYLNQGQRGEITATESLKVLLDKYEPEAIAIGNGTAGRETEAWVKSALKTLGKSSVIVVMVSEAGASVYSASDVAREEFPDLDLTVRGAISIGRRLQDPLAELVKVEPKAMGVGQYQHDVFQSLLERKLSEVVESCVNRVGVDANTASAELLSYVAGIGPSLAKKVVNYREANGSFLNRKQFLKVPGLGGKTFEQAAGFLRVRGGAQPLDASSVHPERYALVEEMAKDLGVSCEEIVGNKQLSKGISIERYVSDAVGMLTLKDIVDELQKPGRDPREEFQAPAFREDVQKIQDLKVGMKLEGVVTNVTAFGCFVDLGVHQDGLIHISELSDEFVKDPSQVVKAGQRIQVRVLELDLDLKRISLSAKKGESVKREKKMDHRPSTRERKPSTRKMKPQKENSGFHPFEGL